MSGSVGSFKNRTNEVLVSKYLIHLVYSTSLYKLLLKEESWQMQVI